MPQPLIVSIPQRLGRQEAKLRLDTGIARLKPELGAILSVTTWRKRSHNSLEVVTRRRKC